MPRGFEVGCVLKKAIVNWVLVLRKQRHSLGMVGGASWMSGLGVQILLDTYSESNLLRV